MIRGGLLLGLLLPVVALGCADRPSGSPGATPVSAPSPVVASPPASPPSPPVTAVASPSAPPAGAGAGDGWTTYHGDPARTGAVAAPFDVAAVALGWESPPLDGDVYAQPLATGGRAFVATENDSVYALDGSSGQVVWQAHLGEPVARGALPCGNIDPVGITSTPVIDPAAGLLYAVAFQQPAHHELYALDLTSGAVRFHRPIDPPDADPRTHLSRAALALAGGRLYVPFGGRFGDCGLYHGWVVAARASDGAPAQVYQVPAQREAGIWAPSGAAVDADGNLFVATGNGESTTAFDFGNAVVKLSPDLDLLDWFAPTDWAALSRRDADLGSVGPALLDGGLVFQVGKAGVGYLLQADRLGEIGGELFQGPVCAGAYGGTAYAPPFVYVACQNGLVALRVEGQSFTAAWRGPAARANPPVVAGGAVWSIDPGSGALLALDARDGSARFRSPPPERGGGLPHFVTPGFGSGRLLVARGRSVAAFGPG